MYTIAQVPENKYANYFDYAVQLCGEGNALCAECIYVPIGRIVEKITVVFEKSGNTYSFADFKNITTEYERLWNANYCTLIIKLSEGPADIPTAEIKLTLKRDGLRVYVNTESSEYAAIITGRFIFGKRDSVCAVSLDRTGIDLRSSLGPATSKLDNALFDRDSDRAICLESDNCRIRYDFNVGQYQFTAKREVHVQVVEHVFASRFHVNYKGINKNSTFPTPPAGWMTWYAVKFDACEQAVIENTIKQKELFADYGANTVWVDWEWYHSGFDVEEGEPNIHYFSPDPIRYPNGLAHVADKIREQGFIPSLWVGPTNEQIITDFMLENEHSVYANRVTWCGRYFFDLTNKAYLEEFVPNAFEQVKKWGYDALKWDCLPISLEYADLFHSKLSDPTLTSEQALRRVIQIARDTLGEDFYMLSCAGEWDRAVLFAGDIFDAARIGGDIFSWDEFILNFLERIMRFYSFHNNLLYCDPDNLVIRPEFNTYDQAITRTTMFSLLGLPLTLGDDLRELPQERIDMIRRALPPLDVRPMDIRELGKCNNHIIINLQIAKPFEEWNVVQIANLLTEEQTLTIGLDQDLHLEAGSYLVYDYWKHQFLGKFSENITLNLPAYGSVVLSVRKCTGKKQIVSTSRHISQGGFDLVDVRMDEKKQLYGRSKVVAGEPYVITIYDAEKQLVFDEVLHPEITGEMDWCI